MIPKEWVPNSIGQLKNNCSYYSTREDLYSHQILLSFTYCLTHCDNSSFFTVVVLPVPWPLWAPAGLCCLVLCLTNVALPPPHSGRFRTLKTFFGHGFNKHYDYNRVTGVYELTLRKMADTGEWLMQSRFILTHITLDKMAAILQTT